MRNLQSIATTLAFAATTLISAFLVFQVQPVISKSVLPWFGGSPAVWTTCMLVFQVLLFAGYAYAHLSVKLLRPTAQGGLHFGLLAAAVLLLPIAPSHDWKPDPGRSPSVQLLWILLANVGLPYFFLSSTGPLLQAWFRDRQLGNSPYRLYALSNLGSLAALLTYPFVVEPALSTRWQGFAWSLGFCLFAIGCAYLAAGTRRRSETVLRPNPAARMPIPVPRRMLWVILPALASVVLLATTNHLCQDIAVIPFLWVAPLALYLLTFIICFEGDRWYSRRLCAAITAITAVGLCVMLEKGLHMRLVIEVGGYLLFLFWSCMLCHGEVVRMRPAATDLTSFYLCISGGGALGGLFVAIVCPQLFSTHQEMNLAIVVVGVCALAVLLADARETWLLGRRRGQWLAWAASGGIVLYIAAVQLRDETAGDLACVRNFYGVVHVRPDERLPGTTMIHGRTTHGFQFSAPDMRRIPTTYYSRPSGVGIALEGIGQSKASIRVGAVGLGCGTVAAYGRPGDLYRFYEINPAVVDLAEKHFTFLADCEAETELILGDARLSLEREPPQDFDVLILDAFSSDSIPTHLLTAEAFAIYQRHLATGGVIAIHISNRNLKLDPVVLRLAKQAQMECVQILNCSNKQYKVLYSKWMLLTRNSQFLQAPSVAQAARYPQRSIVDFPLWTDQYNNLYQILTVY